MRSIPLLLTLLLLGQASATLSAPLATPTCTLALTPDEVRGASYHVTLHVSRTCPPTATFRVRKSSTLNVRGQGAPYQPIRPNGSPAQGGLFSWTVQASGQTNIPRGELWTSLTWEWQRYFPERWNPRTGTYGVWQRIPVPETP